MCLIFTGVKNHFFEEKWRWDQALDHEMDLQIQNLIINQEINILILDLTIPHVIQNQTSFFFLNTVF